MEDSKSIMNLFESKRVLTKKSKKKSVDPSEKKRNKFKNDMESNASSYK
jgi:hypothetical protein